MPAPSSAIVTLNLPGAHLARYWWGDGTTSTILTVACDTATHCGSCSCEHDVHTIALTDRDTARIRALLHENPEHA